MGPFKAKGFEVVLTINFEFICRQLDEEIILATKRKRVPHFHGFCSIVIPVSVSILTTIKSQIGH